MSDPQNRVIAGGDSTDYKAKQITQGVNDEAIKAQTSNNFRSDNTPLQKCILVRFTELHEQTVTKPHCLAIKI